MTKKFSLTASLIALVLTSPLVIHQFSPASGLTNLAVAASIKQITIGPRDTLWSLARDNRISGDITIKQAMLAIKDANPHAFPSNNINEMTPNSTLVIPSASEMRQRTAEQAELEVTQQNQAWTTAKSNPSPAPSATREQTSTSNTASHSQATNSTTNNSPVDGIDLPETTTSAATNRELINRLATLEKENTHLANHLKQAEAEKSKLEQQINLRDKQLSNAAASQLDTQTKPSSHSLTPAADSVPVTQEASLIEKALNNPLLYGGYAASGFFALLFFMTWLAARGKAKKLAQQLAEHKKATENEPTTASFTEILDTPRVIEHEAAPETKAATLAAANQTDTETVIDFTQPEKPSDDETLELEEEEQSLTTTPEFFKFDELQAEVATDSEDFNLEDNLEGNEENNQENNENEENYLTDSALTSSQLNPNEAIDIDLDDLDLSSLDLSSLDLDDSDLGGDTIVSNSELETELQELMERSSLPKGLADFNPLADLSGLDLMNTALSSETEEADDLDNLIPASSEPYSLDEAELEFEEEELEESDNIELSELEQSLAAEYEISTSNFNFSAESNELQEQIEDLAELEDIQAEENADLQEIAELEAPLDAEENDLLDSIKENFAEVNYDPAAEDFLSTLDSLEATDMEDSDNIDEELQQDDLETATLDSEINTLAEELDVAENLDLPESRDFSEDLAELEDIQAEENADLQEIAELEAPLDAEENDLLDSIKENFAEVNYDPAAEDFLSTLDSLEATDMEDSDSIDEELQQDDLETATLDSEINTFAEELDVAENLDLPESPNFAEDLAELEDIQAEENADLQEIAELEAPLDAEENNLLNPLEEDFAEVNYDPTAEDFLSTLDSLEATDSDDLDSINAELQEDDLETATLDSEINTLAEELDVAENLDLPESLDFVEDLAELEDIQAEENADLQENHLDELEQSLATEYAETNTNNFNYPEEVEVPELSELEQNLAAEYEEANTNNFNYPEEAEEPELSELEQSLAAELEQQEAAKAKPKLSPLEESINTDLGITPEGLMQDPFTLDALIESELVDEKLSTSSYDETGEIDPLVDNLTSQLDLATVYLEMGDKVGAQELLDRLADSTNPEIKNRAQQLLAKL